MIVADVKRLNDAERINLDRCYAKSDRQMDVSRRQQALLAAAGMDGPNRRWAIIKVAPNRENDVDNLLARAMIEHWLPLKKADQASHGGRAGRKGSAIWVLAWPGYIFVKVASTAAAWAGVASVKHTKSVLGVDERPFFIDDAMMLKIKAELATLKTVDGPETMYVEGEKVKVVDGPFASFPATVESIAQDGPHAGRARVEVMIFGRAVPVELDLAQLAKSY
ncbi:transcription termination/antitermination protein NusG [Nitratireductor luteus]|uniref:transcription termination/antitermination protein NusG n=1 Tax=Nitratireductor luteus TaxID=2976980 RepID=UPI0022400537|nr:transcription termination/antitermination protein NusG [Nitratireductor luteus]